MRKIPNVKKLLGSTVLWAAALGLAGGGVVGTGLVVGHLRESQDATWCKKVTPTQLTVKGVSQPIDAQAVQEGRAGCAAQRREQRGIFGAVWRTGGQETAVCAVDWGRYQQLADTDPADAAAVITPFGIKDQLDAGSRADQQHFITTCLKKRPTS